MEPRAGQQRTRSWHLRPEPPAAGPGGGDNGSAVLELTGSFVHYVWGRKMKIVLKEFTRATDKGKAKGGQF